MQDINNNFLNRPYRIPVWNSYLEYSPCTIWEWYEFMEQCSIDDKYIAKFLVDFIRKNGTHTFYEDKYWIEKEIKYKIDIENIDFPKLWETLKDTYFKWLFWEKKWWWVTPIWFIIYILGRVWDPYEIMKKWTMSQLDHYLDGLEYHENMKTEEWIERNKKWQKQQIKPEDIKKDLEEIDDIAQQYLDGKLQFKEE